MEKETTRNGLTRRTVKIMASVARNIAQDGVDGRCFVLVHQPKAPKDLAKRLELLKNN